MTSAVEQACVKSASVVQTLPLADVDREILAPGDRDPRAPHFAGAVADLVRELWRPMGGEAIVTVRDDAIDVAWTPSPTAPPPLDVIAVMIRRREFRQVVVVLRLLVSAAPGDGDPDARLMLGEALEELGRDADADDAYLRAIEVGERTAAGEQAKAARTRIAEARFHHRLADMERPDAVMYCRSAIKLFDEMTDAEVQRIAFEIGLLAAGGLDVNDAAAKHRLKSLPGEFSGLNLLCLMYVGFQRIEPGADIGFDLRREYEAARGMVETD